MELIHKPEKRCYISEQISIKDFIQEWMDVLERTDDGDISETSYRENHDDADQQKQKDRVMIKDIAEAMSQPLHVVEGIHKLCSIESLNCEHEFTIDNPCDYKIPKNVDLLSSKNRKVKLDQLVIKKNWRQTIVKCGRYQHHNQLLYDNLHNDDPNDDDEIESQITGPDVILDIQIFRPTKGKKDSTHANVEVVLDQEIRVLGRQPLTVLRNKIHCTLDYTVPEELSENPFNHTFHVNKNVYKSGFLFIGDVFYNDLRDSSNTDYSKVIRDWAEKKTDFGQLKTGNIEETCFGQLTIRLGYPYVYQHQGYCEHLIVFSDLRILSPIDCQDFARYPIVKSISRKGANKCMMCNSRIAGWLTTGDERLPETPFFFCDRCFGDFNYKDGKKLADFKAYSYFDRSALP